MNFVVPSPRETEPYNNVLYYIASYRLVSSRLVSSRLVSSRLVLYCIVFYYMALSHKDWELPIDEFDWLKSILTAV